MATEYVTDGWHWSEGTGQIAGCGKLVDTATAGRYGQRWNSVTLPYFLAHKTNLASVLALPGGDVWVAGGIPGGASKAQGVTALWNDRAWTVDKLASDPATADDVIGDLIPDGNGGIWAMGFTPMGCACRAGQP